jgi:hypothetical protein
VGKTEFKIFLKETVFFFTLSIIYNKNVKRYNKEKWKKSQYSSRCEGWILSL